MIGLYRSNSLCWLRYSMLLNSAWGFNWIVSTYNSTAFPAGHVHDECVVKALVHFPNRARCEMVVGMRTVNDYVVCPSACIDS